MPVLATALLLGIRMLPPRPDVAAPEAATPLSAAAERAA
jgi:hypothetical protein